MTTHIKRRWHAIARPVLTAVCERYEIKVIRVESGDTHASAAGPRRVAFLALRLMGLSYPQIGKVTGGYSHTSVLIACRRVTPEEAIAAEQIAAQMGPVANTEASRREALFRANVAKWRELCADDVSYQVAHEAVAARAKQEELERSGTKEAA